MSTSTKTQQVGKWLVDCFGEDIAHDQRERNHRFLEEALELVQSLGGTREDAHMLVDYVFDREVGETMQELGGVLITLHALTYASDMNTDVAFYRELARVHEKIDRIREKQAKKPKGSPLPGESR